MKRFGFKTMILLGIMITVTVLYSRGQGSGLQSFSLKVSPGALSYYGDLSTDDFNVFKRIAYGSRFGGSAALIKQFSPFFGIQAQFSTGSLYTAAPDHTYFTGSLMEGSLSARIDPLKLIKGYSFGLSPYLSVGLGTFSFRSVHREMDTNLVLLPAFGYNEDGITNAGRKTALSMPMAAGLSFRILPYLQIELEHSLRMTNTDLLDCFKGASSSNDFYALTTIGLRFNIPARSRDSGRQKSEELKVPIEKTGQTKEVMIVEIPSYNLYVDFDAPEKLKSGQILDVKLRINKGKYAGPAKLIQKYPFGFTGAEDITKNTGFSFTNQKVIIDWDKMPADTMITYNYRILVDMDVNGSQIISGSLEYKEADGIKTVFFNREVFVYNPNRNEEQDLSNNRRLKQNDSTEPAGKAPLTKGNIRQSQPLAGIEFRVQCGAFRENKSADIQLAAKHKITEVIQEEFVNGWYKYTVGSFRTYEEAVKYRDKFIAKTGILSAFLVGYKDGHRLANIADALR